MRIITGTAKGCKLLAPSGMSTRPTADRVKESLFNILGEKIAGRRTLDIFAGTGNLGLEALSRHAKEAVFIDRATTKLIAANADRTKLREKTKIIAGNALQILPRLQRAGEIFDLIFADPPYKTELAAKVLSFLDAGTLLAENGIFLLEHGEFNEPNLSALVLVRRENYGSLTHISFYQRRSWFGGGE